MNRPANILFVLYLILFGPVINIEMLYEQDNPLDKKAEHLLTIANTNLWTNNLDLTYKIECTYNKPIQNGVAEMQDCLFSMYEGKYKALINI